MKDIDRITLANMIMDHCVDFASKSRLANCQRFPGRVLFSWLQSGESGSSRPIYIPMKSCDISSEKRRNEKLAHLRKVSSNRCNAGDRQNQLV